MSRKKSIQVGCLTLLLTAMCGEGVLAIVRRTDVPESVYIDFSTSPDLEATGLWKASSTCSSSGATLIAPQWALTAGHCIPAASATNVDFILGPSELEQTLSMVPDLWFRHTNYSSNLALGRDLGLIHLPTPILDVTPAQLNRTNSDLSIDAITVGYGRTGTGTTGEVGGGEGIRRAGTNRIDGAGASIGASNRVFVGDFDNPLNPGESATGTAGEITPLEGMVALFDSGGAWYTQESGTTYFSGVTSFRTGVDGTNTNSDYGDIFGATRIRLEIPWIESNSNPAFFWVPSSGSFSASPNWDRGSVPGGVDTAVIKRGIATISSNTTLEHLFVDGTGRLVLDADLTADNVLLKRGGVIEIGNNGPFTRAINGDFSPTTGTLNIVLHGGLSNGRLNVNGTAMLDGQLQLSYGSGYEGPFTRGQIDSHLILTSSDLSGEFDSVNGIPLGTTMTYVGSTEGDYDGFFRKIDYGSSFVIVTEYLALGGDANGDFTVDLDDFHVWNANKFTPGLKDWTSGDFNGDGVADISDFHIWNANKFTTVEPGLSQVVPEPSWWGLAAAFLPLLLARFRSRRDARDH